MELKIIDKDFTVSKVASLEEIQLNEFCFAAITDEEISLVCPTEMAPSAFLEREDGWKGFRIQGVLDFSLIGILAPIASILAQNKIGIFAVSTYNTDYILIKKENFALAVKVLKEAGYDFI
jgi:hypothetical protein